MCQVTNTPWEEHPVSEAVKHQASDQRDPGEVLVEGKNGSAVLEGNGCNQGVNGCERDAFAARCPVDRSRGAIGLEASGLEHVPLCEKPLNTAGVPGEPLQDLGYHHSSKGEGFAFLNHAPQFATRASGRGTEKVNPDRAVDQDQARFLRAACRSPFQTPLP